jgi:hypothetical protein
MVSMISSRRDLNSSAALKKMRLLSVGCVCDHVGNASEAESTALWANPTSAADAVHTTFLDVEFVTLNVVFEWTGLLSIQSGTLFVSWPFTPFTSILF